MIPHLFSGVSTESIGHDQQTFRQAMNSLRAPVSSSKSFLLRSSPRFGLFGLQVSEKSSCFLCTKMEGGWGSSSLAKGEKKNSDGIHPPKSAWLMTMPVGFHPPSQGTCKRKSSRISLKYLNPLWKSTVKEYMTWKKRWVCQA